MSDANDNDGRDPPGAGGSPVGPGGRAPLTLKPRGAVPAGTVRQSFSHGRSKTVVVETKRRRADERPPEIRLRPTTPPARPSTPDNPMAAANAAEAPQAAAAPQRPPAAAATGRAGAPAGLTLSDSERAARQRALQAAREVEDRRTVETHRQDEPQDREAGTRAEPVAAAAVPEHASPERASEAAAEHAPEPVIAAAPVSAPAPVTTAVDVKAAAPAEPADAPAPVAASPIWERLGQTRRTEAPADRVEAGMSAERGLRPQGAASPSGARTEGGYGARTPRSDAAPAAPGYGARTSRPESGGYGDRSARPPAGGYRSDSPAAGYGARPARPDSGGYGDRPRVDAGPGYGARTPRPEGGGYGDRPRPEGAYGARARPEGAGYGAGPRPAARPEGGGGGYGDRAPRPPREGGDTVRYSALAPRPAGPRTGPGGPRPAGGLRGASAPSAPELTKTTRSAPPRAGERRPLGATDDDDRGGRRGAGAAAVKAVSRTKGEPKRREGRLTIQAVAGDGDTAERMRSLASVRRAREREKEKRTKGVGGAEQGRVSREVVIPDTITVQDLAQRMAIRAVDIIKYLMRQGTMLTINDVLDADTAELIASEFGHVVKRVSESDVETGFLADDDVADGALPRSPVVTIMGHVDHGKTSLLDALRSADVASGETGGITQHIGAYRVRLEDGESVTFLDTPGHAAFSAMRARGANVTDIVVLVVAADDGVMPQTIEAINHAKAANAPIIVAINKIDKPDANPQRVINELLQHEIVVESLGGETQAIEVSATQKLGLDDLIEGILLQAEVLDLRANPDRSAEGVIIEAKLDRGRGPVATVLVQRGTLKRSDIVVAGQAWGRVRALVDDHGDQVQAATPSEPVEILGLDQAPSPGDAFAVVENEARARELTEYRVRQRRESQTGAPTASASLADMMAKLQNKQVRELALVIKADVQGSAEAISGSLEKLGNDEVRARIIHSGVGAITESDVLLAKGAGSPIIGFNVRASKQARDLATREGVEIRYYAIIYDLLDDLKGVLSGMLSPLQRETWLGNATVLEVFNITKVGNVAGCRVSDGVVRRGAKVRVVRDNIVIQEMGTLQTLKRFKDDVAEVISGQECGMNYTSQDIKPGDVIECFTVETVARTL